MQTYSELLNKALLLSEQERALLAKKLVISLDSVIDKDAEKYWQTEIERRIKESDNNEISLLDWEKVKDSLNNE